MANTSAWKPVDESAWKPVQEPPKPPPVQHDIVTGAALGGKDAPIGEQPVSPMGQLKTFGETLKGAGKELGSTAYGLATGPAAGPIGMGLGYLGKRFGITPKVEAATEPSNASQKIGKYGAMAGELLAPAPEALSMIPRAGRASERLGQVMDAVGRNTPVNIDAAAPAALRAQELSNAAFSRPKALKVVRDLVAPGAEQPSFRMSNDLATNLGSLSGKEAMRVKGPMRGATTDAFGAIRKANVDAADQVGMGGEYQKGIDEYRQAKTLQRYGKNAAKVAIPAAIGYGAYHKLGTLGGP